MPRISQFYGITIYMYFDDHAPPHRHAFFGENEALVEIATGTLFGGALPRRAAKLVKEWVGLHRDQLVENWRRASQQQPLLPIEPLD